MKRVAKNQFYLALGQADPRFTDEFSINIVRRDTFELVLVKKSIEHNMDQLNHFAVSLLSNLPCPEDWMLASRKCLAIYLKARRKKECFITELLGKDKTVIDVAKYLKTLESHVAYITQCYNLLNEKELVFLLTPTKVEIETYASADTSDLFYGRVASYKFITKKTPEIDKAYKILLNIISTIYPDCDLESISTSL
ncbi:hypothetical protein HA050_19165 [Iodobacter sp. HSC-16F04]|uniref:Uncharacterized protein n=1 Tax=Iodobacter violaceini TaxID=3044271 RepID=A0ABX0L046_9NEIS|nr:hypothetical protein [Iodobacter violacea]NHQ88228.1 hypothetical protein [Iodobacter violacea]